MALDAATYAIVDAPGTYRGAYPDTRGWVLTLDAAEAISEERRWMTDKTWLHVAVYRAGRRIGRVRWRHNVAAFAGVTIRQGITPELILEQPADAEVHASAQRIAEVALALFRAEMK